MEEEWGEEGTCDICGEEDVQVCLTNNPFLRDVYPDSDNPDEYWCRECYDVRAGDI
ncbi:MAG: hypothetical protein ACPGGD_03150 [Thalassolituus sp.]|jgi:hypothetical protein